MSIANANTASINKDQPSLAVKWASPLTPQKRLDDFLVYPEDKYAYKDTDLKSQSSSNFIHPCFLLDLINHNKPWDPPKSAAGTTTWSWTPPKQRRSSWTCTVSTSLIYLFIFTFMTHFTHIVFVLCWFVSFVTAAKLDFIVKPQRQINFLMSLSWSSDCAQSHKPAFIEFCLLNLSLFI